MEQIFTRLAPLIQSVLCCNFRITCRIWRKFIKQLREQARQEDKQNLKIKGTRIVPSDCPEPITVSGNRCTNVSKILIGLLAELFYLASDSGIEKNSSANEYNAVMS